MNKNVQTTERTSKRLKGRLVVSYLVAIAGGVTLWIGFQQANDTVVVAGVCGVVGGALLALITKAEIWWHHG